jgi:hypothetical protein
MTRKTFKPPSLMSDIFSRVDPVLEPLEEGVNLEMRKLSFSRTFSRNKWRPTAQFRSNVHSATMGSSMFVKTEDLKKKTFS